MSYDFEWDGMSTQRALLDCEIVVESRMTDAGPGPLYFLKLGPKIIPLGINHHFADMLQFALRRNAEAFEAPSPTRETSGPTELLKIALSHLEGRPEYADKETVKAYIQAYLNCWAAPPSPQGSAGS